MVAPEALEATVGKLAGRLAKGAPLAMKGILEAVHGGVDLPLSDGLELECNAFADVCRSEDMREGTTAFLEKRKAEFTGR